MSQEFPELEGWDELLQKARNTHPNSFANEAFIEALHKTTLGIFNASGKITPLTNGLDLIGKKIDSLNTNLKNFNRQSSKIAVWGLILTGLIAFATILSAAGVFIEAYKK